MTDETTVLFILSCWYKIEKDLDTIALSFNKPELKCTINIGVLMDETISNIAFLRMPDVE